MDADILDELGVTTLVWDAMATALEDDPGYQKALERNQQYFDRAEEETHQLQTQTGLQLYNERIRFWRQCLANLRFELGLE